MKLDPKTAFGPLAALVALFIVSLGTLDALRRAGPAASSSLAAQAADDAAVDFERRLAAPDSRRALNSLRDPFHFVAERAAVVARQPAARGEAPAPAVPAPVLTAIIWDNDPRAAIRWNGRDYVVKLNSQIDNYQVRLIDRDQVLLSSSLDSLVLRLHRKGE